MSNRTSAVGVPASRRMESVTPSDTGAVYYVALYVGSAGDVKVDDGEGNAVTFTNVPQGTTLGGVFTRVYATGTTASNLIGYA